MDTKHSIPRPLHYLHKFNLLPIDTPPNFVERLGCLCLTDFVAFYPDKSGNAMVYDNGFWEDDIDTKIWSEWASQHHIAEQLRHIDFAGDSCVSNALILNVVTSELYESDEDLAREFLCRYFIDSKGLPRIM